MARAIGRLAKTDRLDAELIARFAGRVRPEPRPVLDEQAQILAALVAPVPPYRRNDRQGGQPPALGAERQGPARPRTHARRPARVAEMFTKILQEHRAGTGSYDALNVIPS